MTNVMVRKKGIVIVYYQYFTKESIVAENI